MATSKNGGVTTLVVMGVISSLLFFAAPAFANRYSSTSYTIDASTMNTFGGSSSSTSYNMVSSGGEAVIGNGTGGSYKMGQGYVAQLEPNAEAGSIEMSVLPSGLLLSYPFDEGEGTTAYDQTMNDRDGTLVGSPTWSTGKVGGALTFGAATRVSGETGLGAEVSADPGELRTVAAWVKTGTSANTQMIAWNNSNCLGWYLEIMSSGVLGLMMSSGDSGCTGTSWEYLGSDWSGNTKRFDDNQWHYVVGVVDRSAGKLILYGDGEKLSESSISYDKPGSSSQFRVGNNWDDSQPMLGTIDELKVYDRALSATEIQNEYAAVNTHGTSGAFTIPAVVPGVPQQSDFDSVVKTNASSYSLAIEQYNLLYDQSNTNSIPRITSTISDPQDWINGTTKGLGFTLVSGSSVSSVWGGGTKYAQMPQSPGAQTFHSRTGMNVEKEAYRMRLKVDVAAAQAMGTYADRFYIIGTSIP